MRTSIKATKYELSPETEALVEKKLAAPLRLMGGADDTALLEIEVEEAPPEGRSSEPCRLVARLSVDGEVYRAEAVKPNPESAADRVRSQLEAEIRRDRGRGRKLWKRGGSALKRMLRLGE
ncbi:MAG TPA: HPF/RaiA family ribosome-associated protein [Candidatus Paceibacterota bacterium]|nr:HPF/RaiA family ribosome-associated protein [Candidatus Paceibacterota bacterium]